MSDLKFNSMAGAVLASVLGVMVVGIGAEAIVAPNYPEQAGYLPDVAETPSGGPAAPAGPPDFGRLFADPALLAELVGRGERTVAACKTCHNFDSGGPNGTGPNLHDLFGRQVASHAGFEYTQALAARGGVWDDLTLNEFLRSPGQSVPGTRMSLSLRRDQDRIAVIAYLRSISPNSLPLPAPLPEIVAEAPAEAPAQTPPS